MIILELGKVVDVAVDGDVKVIGLVVRRHLGGCEDLGHGYGGRKGETGGMRRVSRSCMGVKSSSKRRKEGRKEGRKKREFTLCCST